MIQTETRRRGWKSSERSNKTKQDQRDEIVNTKQYNIPYLQEIRDSEKVTFPGKPREINKKGSVFKEIVLFITSPDHRLAAILQIIINSVLRSTLVGWLLWHMNHCGLLNAKSCLYIYMKYI